MGKNNYFRFKQFEIVQNKAAMKVGTDGVLLGAWARVAQAKTILDVGAGTGLISIMMAQRSKAQITGIEIEKNAAAEAVENVTRSPWKEQIHIIHSSFQDFVRKSNKVFDLIISNPPFYSETPLTSDTNRALAKHNQHLSFTDLISGANKLCSPTGLFAVILPAGESDGFLYSAKNTGFFLARKTDVKPRANKGVNRVLLELVKQIKKPEIDTLEIYNVRNTDYTTRYKKLTKDFYLKF